MAIARAPPGGIDDNCLAGIRNHPEPQLVRNSGTCSANRLSGVLLRPWPPLRHNAGIPMAIAWTLFGDVFGHCVSAIRARPWSLLEQYSKAPLATAWAHFGGRRWPLLVRHSGTSLVTPEALRGRLWQLLRRISGRPW